MQETPVRFRLAAPFWDRSTVGRLALNQLTWVRPLLPEPSCAYQPTESGRAFTPEIEVQIHRGRTILPH